MDITGECFDDEMTDEDNVAMSQWKFYFNDDKRNQFLVKSLWWSLERGTKRYCLSFTEVYFATSFHSSVRWMITLDIVSLWMLFLIVTLWDKHEIQNIYLFFKFIFLLNQLEKSI